MGLKEGDVFHYWFDFGDDWWHWIEVKAIENRMPEGRFPKVIARVGDSPPQYANPEELEWAEVSMSYVMQGTEGADSIKSLILEG